MELRDCLNKLRAAGRLTHVRTEVDAVHELAGVAARLEGGNVVQFDHVKGYDFPVVTGLWWNRENLAEIFNTTAEDLSFLFARAVSSLDSDPVAPVVVDDAPAQKVCMPPDSIRNGAA